jgi:hypothetical protein
MGHALILEDRLSLPNGQQIPNDGTGCRLKHGIDAWLATQTQTTLMPVQQVSFTYDTPLHLSLKHNNSAPLAHIEEVIEAHVIQIIDNEEVLDSDSEDFIDLFQVFTAKRKKHETRCSKLPELQPLTSPTKSILPASGNDNSLPVPAPPAIPSSSPVATPPIPTLLPTLAQASLQYCYQSTAEDQWLILELKSWLMEGKLA